MRIFKFNAPVCALILVFLIAGFSFAQNKKNVKNKSKQKNLSLYKFKGVVTSINGKVLTLLDKKGKETKIEVMDVSIFKIGQDIDVRGGKVTIKEIGRFSKSRNKAAILERNKTKNNSKPEKKK